MKQKGSYNKLCFAVCLVCVLVPAVLFWILPSTAPGKPRWREEVSCSGFAGGGTVSLPVRRLALDHPNHFALEMSVEELERCLTDAEVVTGLVRIPGEGEANHRYWIRWRGEDRRQEDVGLFLVGPYSYEGRELTEYVLSALETRVKAADGEAVGRLLFPTFLLADSEVSAFAVLTEGEDLPLLSGPTVALKGSAVPQGSLEWLEGFYADSRWYSVEREGESALRVVPDSELLEAAPFVLTIGPGGCRLGGGGGPPAGGRGVATPAGVAGDVALPGGGQTHFFSCKKRNGFGCQRKELPKFIGSSSFIAEQIGLCSDSSDGLRPTLVGVGVLCIPR